MAITEFKGKYLFLSNFYTSTVEYQGLTFKNAEAAFQAQKCRTRDEKEKFCGLDASSAKRLGRHVILRSDREEVKVQIMFEIVYAKFTQNAYLKRKLMETGDERLVEGNWWGDTTWGMCEGKGKNLLGAILMNIRSEFQEQA